jgi:CHAT domain-containing protein
MKANRRRGCRTITAIMLTVICGLSQWTVSGNCKNLLADASESVVQQQMTETTGLSKIEQEIQSLEDTLQKTSDPNQRQDLLWKIGDRYQVINRFDQAVRCYKEAIPIREGLKKGVAGMHNRLGQTYKAIAKADKNRALEARTEALKHLKIALALMDAEVLDPRQAKQNKAIAFINIGELYQDCWALAKAIENYLEAQNLFKQLSDTYFLGVTAHFLYRPYALAGKPYTALSYSDEALGYFDRIQNLNSTQKTMKASALANKAIVMSTLGAHGVAEELYKEAEKLRVEVNDPKELASHYQNLSVFYYNLKENDKSLVSAYKGLDAYRSINNSIGMALCHNNIGMFYTRRFSQTKDLQDGEKSLSAFNTAREILNGKDIWTEGTILHNIGWLYLQRQDFAKALEYLNQALPLRKKVRDLSGEAYTYNVIGDVQFFLGDFSNARNNCLEALRIRRLRGEKIEIARSLYLLARIEAGQENLEQAWVTLEKALEIVDVVREASDSANNGGSFLRNPDGRISFFTSLSFYYSLAIDWLMKLHKKNPSAGYNIKALEVNERLRMRTLANALLASQQNEEQLDEETRKQLRTLEQKMMQIGAQVLPPNCFSDEPRSILEPEAQQELATLEQEYIELTAPKLLKFSGKIKKLSAEDIQTQFTDAETMLLAFKLGEQESYLWTVTNKTIESYTLPSRSEILTLIPRDTKTQKYLIDDTLNPLPGAPAKVVAYATDLGKALLPCLAKPIPQKRLVIVADEFLERVPFALLRVPADPQNPLVKNYDLVLEPSVSTLAAIRRNVERRNAEPRAMAQKGIAVVAPEFRPEGVIIHRKFRDREVCRGGNCIFLPKTSNGTLSKATLLSADLHLYRYLHFSSHGEEIEGEPRLQLSPTEYLLPKDIYALQLSADLVIVSACVTNFGKDHLGEGMQSITRAFLYAGAPRVIAILWESPSGSAEQLMEHFYENILAGQSPSQALGNAQRKMIKLKASPKSWAGFVLQGEWR